MHVEVVSSQCKTCAYSVVATVQGGEVGSGWKSLEFGRVDLHVGSQHLAGLVEDDGASPLRLLL